MDVELIEIREFLAALPPFDQLDGAQLDRLPKELSIRYLRRGTAFPPQDAERACLYIVRKGAVEWRSANDELITKDSEGDLYGAPCLPQGGEANLRGMTVEDSLFYLLPCAALQALRDENASFDGYFAQSAAARLRHARESLQDAEHGTGRLLTVEIGRLLSRTPVCAAPHTPIQDAAQLMTRERVSALLITEQQRLIGIITDRDLRSRCIAKGLDTSLPVSEIMTRNLHKVTPDTPAFEVLIGMTRHKVHHLPVVSNKGVEGIVTTTDLIRYQSTNSIYAVDSLRKCRHLSELMQASAALPELQVQLVAAGANTYQLGQAISAATDAITQRLLELAEESLGDAPIAYVWVACGSQGRREQTTHSDQDNALILSDDYDEQIHGDYFARLARFTTDGLHACGFINCPGEVMASNPQWRQPLRVWRRYFDGWITRTDHKAAMLATNFFDLRPIHGDASLHQHLHAEALQQARENRLFLAYMAANAVGTRPPLGFFRSFVLISEGEHANSLDIKRRGLLPVINLARVHALAAGLPELNTIDRLKAAADMQTLDAGSAANLEDAFEFIGILRARHQAQQIKRGAAPDNYLAPERLSPMERKHLKDAFVAINALQEAVAQHYQTERLH